MKFTMDEFLRLSDSDKDAVRQWTADHFGDYRLVGDVGITGDVAWGERLLLNAEGKRYAVGNEVAKETVRAPVMRPFPIQVSV